MTDNHFSPIYLNSVELLCSLGANVTEVANNLFGPMPKKGHLTLTDQYSSGRDLHLGLVKGELPATPVEHESSRNNQFLTAVITPLLPAIERLKSRYGAHRIGIVLGTSTSGIAEAEKALVYHHQTGTFPDDYHYRKQEVSAPSRFLAAYLGISGPAWTVSTACTSGGKALASAARLLRLGVCDAVIAGGADTLCRMTLEGFSSLSVTDNDICNPFSRNRKGINIGEGAALFIVSRDEGPVRVAGYGESSDAHHISAPHPEGVGAEIAMRQALKMANVDATAIDYLNFHGTATPQNDKMEGIAAHRVLGNEIACSSTKPLTGHTLAAAGAIESAFCWLSLQRNDGLLPPHLWDGQVDPDIPVMYGLAKTTLPSKMKMAMSNSFAFGGNNISLILAGE